MKKILIVEDDAMLVEIYMKKFSDEGFDVINANSGSKAEQVIKKERPDLVLLDLVLPEEDGFEVLGKIKSNEETKEIKIIVFSNLSQEEDKERAKRLGANGFITKSDFTPKEIVNEVKKILGNELTVDKQSASKDEPGIPAVAEEEVKEEKEGLSKKENDKKILIMEDEEVFAELFGKRLKEEGYSVDVVKNGAWGVKQSQEKKYDVFLVDILMPDIDGIEVIKMIKKDDNLKNVPLVVTSNSVDEDEKKKELEALGVDEFFVKSKITPSELTKVINSLIK